MGAAVGDFPAIEMIEGSGILQGGRLLPISGLPKSTRAFTRIRSAQNARLFACASSGVIARSRDGIEWQALDTGISDDLSELCFLGDQIGYAVGQGGAIIATRDGGESWEREKRVSSATLNAVDVANGSAFAVGEKGTLIATDLAERVWRPVVVAGAASGGRHGWLPAPWYYLSLLLLLGLVRRIPDEVAEAPAKGIGQILISDKPLGPGDPDHLGFREVAGACRITCATMRPNRP